MFNPVPFNPDAPIFQTEMEKDVMRTPDSVPTDPHKQIIVVSSINNRNQLYLILPAGYACLRLNHSPLTTS